MLIICSIKDIKTREIPIVLILIQFIVIIIIFPFRKDIDIIESITGGLLGGFLVLISKVSRGRIGVGDGLVLSVTGIGLGVKSNFIMILYGMLFAAIFSMVLIIVKKVNRNYKLPFIPFIFAAYIGVLIW